MVQVPSEQRSAASAVSKHGVCLQHCNHPSRNASLSTSHADYPAQLTAKARVCGCGCPGGVVSGRLGERLPPGCHARVQGSGLRHAVVHGGGSDACERETAGLGEVSSWVGNQAWAGERTACMLPVRSTTTRGPAAEAHGRQTHCALCIQRTSSPGCMGVRPAAAMGVLAEG